MWSEDNRCGAFDLARQRLAREDAERSAWLDRAIARQGHVDDRGERRCEDCHQQLKRTITGRFCTKCSNKHRERERRARARAKLAAKGIAA